MTTVQLKLGTALDTTIEPGLTVADWDAQLHVLDGLVMSWRHGSEELHAPLEPLTASLRLATRDVTNLVTLRLGNRAYVRVLDDGGTVVAAVYGRVADVAAEQSRRWSRARERYELWTTYDVTIVDHTASSDEPVDTNLDNDDLTLIANELEDASGLPIRHGISADPDRSAVGQAGVRDTDNAGVISVLREYLPFMPVIDEADPDPVPVGMLQLAPIANPATGALELISMHLDDWRDPLVPLEVPASEIQLSGAWHLGLAAAVNTVVVKMDEVDGLPKVKAVARAGDWAPGDAVIRRRLDTGDLLRPQQFHADTLAAAYLPDPDDVGWSRESFTWAPDDVAALGTSWFPNWSTEIYSAESVVEVAEDVAPCFRAEVTITGLKAEANLAGTGTSYVGRLRSVDLTLAGGAVAVTFTLRRTR